MNYPPPLQPKVENRRNSNLELYRIIVMLIIVASHYVGNSELIQLIEQNEFTPSGIGMLLFGAWGKTGINCFVMITGYFMCTSRISGHKILKLYLQITFYTLIIYCLFSFTGHESFSIHQLIWKFNPITSVSSNFISCFLIFYLLIPFLNVFVNALNRKQHLWLTIFLLTIFSILPTFTFIPLSMNYVEWFVVVYLIASYLRFYGSESKMTHSRWGYLSIGSILLGCLCVIGGFYLKTKGYVNGSLHYHMFAEPNRPIALAVAVTTFMWFKDLKISHSKLINTLGATTFGVLLIHANSNAMRQWLWKETVDSVGHQYDSLLLTLGYAIGAVVTIFLVCSAIDFLRSILIEPWLIKAVKKIPIPHFIQKLSK